MSRTRLVSAFLVAVCLSAVAASSASASKGEFVNKEGKALVKDAFTGTIGESTLETIHASKVTCKGGTTKGTVTGTKTAEATLTFTGCSSGGMSCHTAGGKEGELAISSAPLTTLQKLSTDIVTEGAKASVTCGLAEISIKGSFLVPIGSTQEGGLKTEYKFTAEQKEGKQIPLEYENSKKEIEKFTLEASFGESFVQAGEAATLTIKFEEEAEFV
jgi:hypothetical protein